MNKVLALQVLISFIAGGGMLTVMSLLAERVNKNVAGIILMFPSTIVIGAFFLGLTTSPQKVADAIPLVLFPLAILIMSALVYIRFAVILSRFRLSKPIEVMATFFLATASWLAVAAPLALFSFSSIVPGTCVYLLSVALGILFYSKMRSRDIPEPMKYTKKQIVFRAVFMGACISMIVLIGKSAGVFWGAVFTMYPAATFSALIILHFYYEPLQLAHFYSNAPIGSFTLFFYCISVMLFFPSLGIYTGTVAAVLVSLASAVLITQLQRSFHAGIRRNNATDLT